MAWSAGPTFPPQTTWPGRRASSTASIGGASAASGATSPAKGDMSMMFTPKGLSVRLRHRSICSFTYWALAFMAEMIPRPPPLETAAASLPSEIQAMPPWKMGYSMPNRSHKGVFIMVGPPF